MDTPTADDYRLMEAALAEARRAGEMGEVPIGAIVAGPRGTVIGRGHNLTETLADVTAHAEMQAITAAALTLGGKYLQGCSLYVTVEPCLMCAGAIAWAQLRRIVIGAPDPKRGYSVLTSASPFHPKARVITGVMAGECAALVTDFFRALRR